MSIKPLIDPYALRQDGSKPLTANWDAGPYKLTAQQLESDVAIGTAPLVITSTTLVSNLNADLWDGYQFSDYLDQPVATTSSPTFVTVKATNLAIDTNLIKTLNALNFVGINVTTPLYTLHVVGNAGLIGEDGDAGTAEDPGGAGDSIYLYPGAGGADGGAGAGADGKVLVTKGIVFTDPTESDVEMGGFGTTSFYMTGKTAEKGLFVDFFTASGDKTDSCIFQLFGSGTKDSFANYESLFYGWGSGTQQYIIATQKGGTGVAQPLNIYTHGNTNQIYLKTDNTVGIGKIPTLGKLDVSGIVASTGLKTGDTTNYTEIKSDGEINLHGTARVTNALWIGAEGIRAPPTQPAAFVDHGISGAWEFSDATDDTIVANMRIPNKMDISVAPSISLGWSSTTLSAFCEWQIEYLWRSLNEDTTAAADDTLLSSTDADASTSSGTAEGMVLSTFSLAAPSATDICLHLRIKRRGDLAADTINGDTVELHGICMGFTSNKLGAAT